MARELDDDTHEAIVEALRQGNFLETAAALAGCTTAQVRRWLREGADPQSDCHRFAMDVAKAMASAESTALSYLREAAAAGDLKAVTWFLERRFPERWGAKVQHIVSQEMGEVLDRVESLEHELGAEIVNRILAAIAGEWGAGSGEVEEETGPRVH